MVQHWTLLLIVMVVFSPGRLLFLAALLQVRLFQIVLYTQLPVMVQHWTLLPLIVMVVSSPGRLLFCPLLTPAPLAAPFPAPLVTPQPIPPPLAPPAPPWTVHLTSASPTPPVPVVPLIPPTTSATTRQPHAILLQAKSTTRLPASVLSRLPVLAELSTQQLISVSKLQSGVRPDLR